MTIEQLKYPIGTFSVPQSITAEAISGWISDIQEFPKTMVSLVENLSAKELNIPYRPEGWNIKQVVHHCADSHMNAIIRFKLALTENCPTIKPYAESAWAQLVDGTNDDTKPSLDMLSGIHKRWSQILKKLSPEDLKREYIHPEHGKTFKLDETIGMYAWHCNHHLAHIKQALEHKGNFN